MFTIKSIYRHSDELVTVKVTMPAKEWSQAKLKGHLGSLYGVDISNEVYHVSGVKAYQPIVNDRVKAKGGIKVIELSYVDSEWVEIDNVVYLDQWRAKRNAA